MKVLILSCDTGQDTTVRHAPWFDAFDRRGNVCEMFDPLTRTKETAHIVSATYSGMLRSAGGVRCALPCRGHMQLNRNNITDIPREYALRRQPASSITSNSFDAVVSTHLFSMEALTAIRRKPDFHVPCFGVLTDYTRIPFSPRPISTGISSRTTISWTR